MRGGYLLLALLGAIIPYSRFFPWLLEHGLDVRRLVSELFATRISGFFGLDVILAAVTLLVFIRCESRRSPVPHAWTAVLATCLVGVSCGLPLFLFLREGARARA